MSDLLSSISGKHARDAMSVQVAFVGPHDSARKAAELMLRLHVSGLPVVDDKGAPLGVVSESDFRFGDLAERKKHREAWLKILSGGQEMAADYLEALEREADHVSQIMASPAICIDEGASLVEAAELLSRHKIRRLVVLRDGKMAGVITRSNLLRFFAPPSRPTPLRPSPAELDQALEAVGLPRAKPLAPHAASPEGLATAAELKNLVAEFERKKAAMKEDARRFTGAGRAEQVKSLLRARYADAELAHLLNLAREAARRGETSCPALVFPCALCSDGGRAINLPDPDWPSTLRGKAADFFLRWDRDLRPQGFMLSARIASFPDGFPGDAEMALVWGR